MTATRRPGAPTSRRRSPTPWIGVAAAIYFIPACASGAVPCAGATCPTGLECLANRCVGRGGGPVPARTLRRVLEPSMLAVISESAPSRNRLPPTVTFGNAALGRTMLYMRFDGSWKAAGDVASAFLVLEPAFGGQSTHTDVPVEVRPIEETWSPERLAWRKLPRAGIPVGRGLARSEPPLPLRMDVTDTIRYLQERPADHGIVVAGGNEEAAGATFHTGVAAGPPPRLELYLRPR